MAGNMMRNPLARVAKRGFAAQTAVSPSEGTLTPEINCTVLPNKMMVSSLDLCGPLTRVSIVFKAGPRNETPKNLGVTHLIRSMAGAATKKCTGFAVLRNIQQSGVHLTCIGDRETTGFHVVGTRNKINCALKFLAAVACAPAFKPWEVRDNNPHILYEIGMVTPQAKLIDMLHKAAFRTGLGNSLFLKKDYLGNHSYEMLHDFYNKAFTANRTAVSGINMHHNDMLEFAKSLELNVSEPIEGNSKYFGGELRKEKNSYFAHVAIATKGVGLKDIKEVLVFAILQQAYGAGSVISWGGSPAPLYKAVYDAAPDAGVRCLNVNYSDTGLFGYMISGPAESVGKAVKEAHKVLKSGSVSDADVTRAKALLKMHILSSSESLVNISDDMGIQSLFGSVIIPAQVLAEAVDKVTTADVTAAAGKVASGKFSLAALGDLTQVPYLDDLS